MNYLLSFIVIHATFAKVHLNLHHTDQVGENEEKNALEYDCLRVPASVKNAKITREIISYCITELLSEFHLTGNDLFPKFTFLELSKQNITSQQLYNWSASIDLVERYQFYLNQLSTTSNEKSLETQIFYNCTLPRFGSMCQYEFIDYHDNYSSLYDIIDDYYRNHPYDSTNLTCYTHLQCNRGPAPTCLTWSEICDGQIDCLDGEFDEENCWQLEINQCNDDEYQCSCGQCIPKEFLRDDFQSPDCLDGTDDHSVLNSLMRKCSINQPSFECEERTCRKMFVTNSCQPEREEQLLRLIYSMNNNSISEQCSSALKCLFEIANPNKTLYIPISMKERCVEIINNTCPDMFYIPNSPLLFGHIYVAHRKNETIDLLKENKLWYYLCYNHSYYDQYFINEIPIIFEGRTCYGYYSLFWQFENIPRSPYIQVLENKFFNLKKYMTISKYNTLLCNSTSTYHCIRSSKCISIKRILDGTYDCLEDDDENITHINSTGLIKLLKNHFKCEISNKYIHLMSVQNQICDCSVKELLWCEDEFDSSYYARTNVTFQTICDRYVELFPITIGNRNETDETECQQWPCNNIYTHCDGIWNCPKGEDEIGCYYLPSLNCSLNHHLCVTPHTNQLMCLPIAKVHDNVIDCLGATDEKILCTDYNFGRQDGFFCDNNYNPCIGSSHLCDGFEQCMHGEDEQFCLKNQSNTSEFVDSRCYIENSSLLSDVERFLCHETKSTVKLQRKYFALDDASKYADEKTKIMAKLDFSTSFITKMLYQHVSECYRGFRLRLWLNKEENSTKNVCLCPPSYYGDQCQYENQRISLTIQFQAFSDSLSTLFAIIISLIDDSDERIIHSYEQLTYLSIRDCKIKYNIYLLYSTRPKNSTKNYSIHVDIYEKDSLNYRGSLLYPVKFLFLPVQRLAVIGIIPGKYETIRTCSYSLCVHGKCIIYSNSRGNDSFCQCYRGWYGRYCTILHTSICSSDSICIGVSTYNRSICACPINKFGYRCLLTNTICQINNNLTCINGGQCIANDEYMVASKTFYCICPNGYRGDRCEIADNEIIFEFEKNIVLSQSIFIHFIEVINDATPIRTTTLRTISFTQKSFTIFWSRPFHLIFIELQNKIYYLAFIEKNYNQSSKIVTMVKLSNLCPNINELFNHTFVRMHIIRRIKYYHLPCQKYSTKLNCFHDDLHLCLCYDYGHERLANCFNFDHNMKFDCSGRSTCQNNGQCFQDSLKCPQRSTCICPQCFHGTLCQFRSSGFGVSLDAILGYHIQQNVRIINQPNIVKYSLIFAIIFMIVGFMDGIISILTFNNKIICEVGCGLYLLGSSITTLIIIILFGLKYFILILTQIETIQNRLFLQIQCLFLDFLLRASLNMDQWLNACVSIERVITIVQGVNFKNTISRRIAKIVIVILGIIIIGASAYDPFYRRLIDE
ncbi:unnamed protein product [Rotaria sp. Silwood2]|nr:unnamed protein product [Rotaria sp. Silwood2]CAF4091040.1 unnamed protein product [Rotaria sp. Silwood2]